MEFAEKGVIGMKAERQEDQTGEAKADMAGKAMVNQILLKPLSALPAPRGVSSDDYDRLAERLAYLSQESLSGLAEYALRHSGTARLTKGGSRRPMPDLLRSWAYAIQPPPPHESEYVGSVMRSVLGEEARDGGWHVQLYRHLRRFGPPLAKSEYAKQQLRSQAERDQRELVRVRERLGVGQQSREDRMFLSAWHDDLRNAEALIEQGIARRAAGGDVGKDGQGE